MNVTGANDVTEASQVAEGRRLALWLASNLDFPEEVADRRIADIRNLEVVAVQRAAKKARKADKAAAKASVSDPAE